MADKLDALLARVDDAALRAELTAQVDTLRRRRQFGLVFEEHLPESVRLPQHRIRRGSKVVRRDQADNVSGVVTKVVGGEAEVLGDEGTETVPVDELVAVAEFGEPIYPGLRSLGTVDRGGDKPCHVVIKGENHHALEALQFTHAGKIDCIYIDPPYNTGARDWKYNNDYVDADDAYRHSKWLAMMQRRLVLARQLLNPEDSVLVVAIDEKEVLRLGLLLQQLFPGSSQQLVSTVTNPAGSPRKGRFTRVEEYLFFVFLGDAEAESWTTTMLDGEVEVGKLPTLWFSAIRTGPGAALRSNRTTPVLFYPLHFEAVSGSFDSVGEPYPMGASVEDYVPPPGTVAVWPLSTDGTEQTWRFDSEQMVRRVAEGSVRFGSWDASSQTRSVTYLRPGTLDKLKSGVFEVVGRTPEGAMIVDLAQDSVVEVPPAAVWRMRSHFARDYGTQLLRRLVPGRTFPFPKSLYAVEDAVRVAVGGKPDALVLDFFAGSGTTAHAVARLNRQDGGSRRSISVTNNEVSEDEAKRLMAEGLRPGDAEWEALGIFEHVTRPRIEAAFTGVTPDGDPVEGDYKFTDEFPLAEGFEENVAFVELTYLDAEAVELDRAFEGIAPLLWMRAGSVGPVLTECLDSAGRRKPYAMSDRYGVLFNPDRWRSFVDKLAGSVTHVFVVTDSASEFAAVAAELPSGVEPVRLYENYLSTFAVNVGGSV